MRPIVSPILFLLAAVTATSAMAQDAGIAAAVEPQISAAREAMLHDPDRAFEHALVAERQALRIDNPAERRTTIATARWLGSEALVRTGHLVPAERLANSASVLASGGTGKLLGDILMTKGGIDAEQVRFAKALDAYQSAYRAFVAARDRRGQAIALQSIANLYVDGGDFANAERYFNQAEEAFSDDPVLALALYNNRATGLMSQRRFEAAAREYRRALEIARTQPGVQLRVKIIGNIAKALLEQDKMEEASGVLQEALRITATPAAAGWRPQIAGIAAQLAFQRRDLERARGWLDQAFSGIDLTRTNASFRDAHSTAYEVYRASGDTVRALAHLQALRRLTDEETRLAASTNTALMAARFDFANQELRIARLKAEELRASVALERSRAQFQRTLTIGVVGGAIAIVGLLSFGIVTLRRSRNEVRAANIDLAASNTALEKALAAKTEFLATTSHEIRTPLNGILGMTQVMLADRTLPPAQRERVQVVHGAGLTMRALVDDILDVAKMETGHLTVAPEPVDLRALLAEIARMWAEQARTKGLAFDLDIDGAPHWIVTDAGRLRQVAFNLLGNALKFTQDGSIGLAVRTIEDGRRFTLSISDTGIGIPEEKHEAIFESFRQADSTTTRQFGGTGLGLTICRNLARALGGDIAVASREGEGAVFTVTLPLVEAEALADVAAAPRGDGIVILERNPIARAVLKTVLAPRTGDIALTDNMVDALAKLPGATRLIADAATLGEDDPTRLAGLARLAAAAAEQGAAAFVLWKEPDAAIVRRIEEMDAMTLIEKPIAGRVLAERLFGVQNDDPPLVTEAA
ncbi:ATP-binding protein [uncultured Sphingomonas sp.]|uniref:tetratricopeptide repeat-containing sensor histidine kinase n=1 Tax=uncultured Sphingomonas sp. TaxID=158754 RepID=UPI0025E2DB5B|nr:ATP-binding protein [uncultured Sphingomonas sp.]